MTQIKVIDHTKEAIDAKNEAVDMALEIIGGKLERYAKLECPVDTGLLRNSITYCLDGKIPNKAQQEAKKGGKSKGDKYGDKMPKYAGKMPEEPDGSRAVYVGTSVEYAPYIEFGTSRMKPRPYLKPAVQDHLQEYRNIITKTLKEVGK